jgi:hypothetical protein
MSFWTISFSMMPSKSSFPLSWYGGDSLTLAWYADEWLRSLMPLFNLGLYLLTTGRNLPGLMKQRLPQHARLWPRMVLYMEVRHIYLFLPKVHIGWCLNWLQGAFRMCYLCSSRDFRFLIQSPRYRNMCRFNSGVCP